MSETQLRSLLKSASWRITGPVLTIATTWFLTQRLEIALSLGLLDVVIKILIFYLHERLWARIPIGMTDKASTPPRERRRKRETAATLTTAEGKEHCK